MEQLKCVYLNSVLLAFRNEVFRFEIKSHQIKCGQPLVNMLACSTTIYKRQGKNEIYEYVYFVYNKSIHTVMDWLDWNKHSKFHFCKQMVEGYFRLAMD